MGYVECFQLDSIPLPPAKIKHTLSDAIGKVVQVNLYTNVNEHEHYEELELACENSTYLFYFSDNEEEAHYAKIEKGKAPSLQKALKWTFLYQKSFLAWKSLKNILPLLFALMVSKKHLMVYHTPCTF